MLLKSRILLFFFLVVLSFNGVAQVSFDSQEELEKAANEFFDANDYTKAKPLFSQLLSKEALNPNYNYRFGVCILFTESDPLKPLPYIEGGANSKGVNIEAYYFLGKALQLNYRFNDAITSYQRAKSAGLNKPNIDLDRSMEECRNGNILYNPAIDFQPAQNKEVIASEFYRPYDFRKLKGKVIPMPPDFKTKYDQKNLTGTVIYTPTNSQTLVYASYGDDGANAKDLYRVNRLPNGELALPLRLPNTINTKYDEDYAFYDEESETLFFASKGHNSMGGYDVFSSTYDANENIWSTPLNLQYPVNSPYDDFLYVSDPDGKVAFFTSRRDVEAGKLRVMKMLLNDPQQVEVSVLEGTFHDRTDSVYNYAALTVYDPATKEVVGKYRSHNQTGKYLLILPPQNDYKMDVGPREANGFKFDLDVPKQESINTLRQGIAYDASGENGTVTVTNYFDATGKPDSIAFAESRSLTEIEEQMVDMPEPIEVLASEQKTNYGAKKTEEIALAKKAKKDSLKQVQEVALEAQQKVEGAAKQASLDAEKVKEDSLNQVAELALQEKNKVEEVTKQDELAKAEKERLEAISEAEQDALAFLTKETAAKLEKARQDSLKQAEEIAAQEKAKINEAIKQAELAKAEKKRLESIREAEEDALAFLKKGTAANAEKARQDSLKQAEEIALQEKANIAAALKQAELAKAEKERSEVIRKSEDEALALLEKETAAKAEKARQDSLEVLGLKRQVAEVEQTAESLEKELVTKALAKAAQDSAQEVEAFEKLKASHLAARAKRDSINQAIELAEQQDLLEKAKAEEAAKQAELAKAEKESLEAIRQAEGGSLALLERETAAAEKANQDSLEEVTLAKQKAEQEKELKNVLTETQEIELKAEKERLATIEQKVELAKEQAMRDSLIQPELVDNTKAKDAEISYDEILKEMAKKEADILEELEVVETVPIDSAVVDLLSNTASAAIPDTSETDLTKETQSETKTLSASELFLQTIAKLEAQKNEQDNLVSKENENREKAESDRKLAQAEAIRAADTTGSQTGSSSKLGLADSDSEANAVVNETSDIETMSIALKSDANPAEYLAALNKIETEIAKEAEINKDKTYELKELNPEPTLNKKEVEPALQAKIDADRKALEAHQKIAIEKERVLNEQMQRDREAITSIDEAAEEELAAMENEVLNELESNVDKSGKVATKGKALTSELETKPEVAKETENTSAKTEEAETEVALENSEQVAENVSSSEQEVLDALAEFDKMLNTDEEVTKMPATTEEVEEEAFVLLQKETAEKARQDSLKQAEQIALQEKTKLEEAAQLAELAKAEREALTFLEEETAVKATQDSLKKTEFEEAAKQPDLTEMTTEPELPIIEVIETPVAENIPAEIAGNKEEVAEPAATPNTQQPETKPSVSPYSEDGVGKIPFMTPALRDYGTRKPSFDKIEDSSMRRMIKRMRSEDIGRIAVLKNMKNDWVDAGKSAESLKDIKENLRNKDVLKSVASAPSREEFVRQPFDKNTLRKRKDVHYKIEFQISTTGVSETVSETMTPEQAISFAMPEFELQTGYYQTLADANSDYRDYRRRGFETARIVPYLKNEPVRLSDVADAPFID
jgi:hypothetical protein